MVEIAVALHEAEALDVVVGESRHDFYARRAQWPPDPFAGAGVHQQAVGIVQFGPPFVGGLDAVAARRRKNIEVSGAMPNLTLSRRGNIVAETSITLSAPG